MFENVGNAAAKTLQTAAAKPANVSTADAAFRALDGMFGQLWRGKFATGVVGADGTDEGVQNAKRIWAHGLREFDAVAIRAALRDVADSGREFAPSLPEFRAICRSHQPRKATVLALPDNGAAARHVAERERLRALRDAATRLEPEPGISTLVALVARAAANAGADEATELRRMDGLFERVPA